MSKSHINVMFTKSTVTNDKLKNAKILRKFDQSSEGSEFSYDMKSYDGQDSNSHNNYKTTKSCDSDDESPCEPHTLLSRKNLKTKLKKEAQLKLKQNRKSELMIPYIANQIGQTSMQIEKCLEL